MKSYKKVTVYKGIDIETIVSLGDNHCGNVVSTGIKTKQREKCYYEERVDLNNLKSIIYSQTENIMKDIDELPVLEPEEIELLDMGFYLLPGSRWI